MTDTQLAVRQTNLEIVRSVDDLLRLGTILVKSGLLPTSVKTPEAAAAIILKGRELHIGAMEALSSINVIQGKPITSPQLMLALARRTGELEDIQIRDDGNTCTVIVKRKGQSPLTTTFSNDDAKRMNLLNKDNWQKQDKTMRQWRAMGANLRVTFGDATSGLYLYEEMGADVDEDGNIIQGETPRKVEHAAVNEEEVAIGIHPEPPGMFEGDAPVVTVAKERIRQAIAESVDKQTGEILAEHQFGNVVLAWKKAKAITGLEKPTLDQIWAMKPAGEDYLRGLCDFEPTGEDEKMVAALKRGVESVRAFVDAMPKQEPLPIATNDTEELTDRAQAQKIANEIKEAGRKYADAAKLVEEVDKKLANHLAAIVGKVFETQPEETQAQMRHAVYSYIRGAQVESADKLYSGLARAMIARWGDGWSVNHLGAFEIPLVFKAHQLMMGQTEMPLGGK